MNSDVKYLYTVYKVRADLNEWFTEDNNDVIKMAVTVYEYIRHIILHYKGFASNLFRTYWYASNDQTVQMFLTCLKSVIKTSKVMQRAL